MSLEQRAMAKGAEVMDEHSLVNRVRTTYLGNHRVEIQAGDRSLETSQRTEIDQPGASFCPLELVAAALGA